MISNHTSSSLDFSSFDEPNDEIERQSKQYYQGLGRDDLVAVYNSKSTDPEYHDVTGYAFCETSSLESYLKLIGKPSHGRVYIWNPFQQDDLLISIDIENEITASYINNPSRPISWYEIRLSSILRYYRCSIPIYSAFFGGPSIQSDNLHLVYPGELANSDIIFSIDNLSSTSDLQNAVSNILITHFNVSQISEFILQYNRKFPNLLFNFISRLPNNCVLLDAIFFAAEDTQRPSQCKRFVPLFFSNLRQSPRVPFALARICLAECHFSDAFHFLNLAAFCHNWTDKFSKIDFRNFIGNAYAPEKRFDK